MLWACSDDPGNATEVALSIKTDLALTTELSSVRVRVYKASDVVARSTPVAEFTLDASQLMRGLPLVIQKKKDADFLLAVQALGPGGVNDPQIERQVRVRFQDGKSLVLHLFLARACVKKACSAVEGQTCFGEMRGPICEGTCAAIDGPDLLNEARNDDANWRPLSCGPGGTPNDGGPVADTGVGPSVDGGPIRTADGGLCTPSLPGAACNTVEQCGCAAGKSCNVVAVTGANVQLGCVAAGTLPAGSTCMSESCAAGHACIGQVCRPYCAANTDCEEGRCVPALVGDDDTPVAALSTCFDNCTGDGDCSSKCCRELGSQPGAGKVCVTAAACAVCAEPSMECTKTSECCGGAELEAVCVSEPTGSALCHSTCAANADCNSDCCAELESGIKACFERSVCTSGDGGVPPTPDAGPPGACRTENQTCGRSADCCGAVGDTAVCVEQEEQVGPICANRCTANAQCGSGCCAPLQVGGSVCAPVVYCQ